MAINCHNLCIQADFLLFPLPSFIHMGVTFCRTCACWLLLVTCPNFARHVCINWMCEPDTYRVFSLPKVLRQNYHTYACKCLKYVRESQLTGKLGAHSHRQRIMSDIPDDVTCTPLLVTCKWIHSTFLFIHIDGIVVFNIALHCRSYCHLGRLNFGSLAT